jgi:type IV pilus assembly protein PilE
LAVEKAAATPYHPHQLKYKGHAMNKAEGFTLIELMIVVAVIAILAVVAIPAYGDYVIRGKLVDASAQLSDMRIKLEQYYQDNRNYGSTSTTCGIALPTSKYFTFSCNWGAGGTDQSYTATAASNLNTGLGAAAGDYAYTIDETNAKKTTKFAGQVSTAACWLMKKGDSC